jgi:signal transduction histidine kinase/FixJ family two-component response regulator
MVDIVLNRLILTLFILLISLSSQAKLKFCDQPQVVDSFISNHKNISDVINCSKETKSFNLGFIKSSKTIFVLDGDLDHKIFYFSSPMIHDVVFYQFNNQDLIATKSYSKINNLGNHDVYFNNLNSTNVRILAVIDTKNSVQLPYKLFTTQTEFDSFLQSKYIFDGIWFGVVFFSFVVALSFYYIRRRSEIAFYSLHILSLFFIQLAFSGYLFSSLNFLPVYLKHRAVVFACSLLTFSTAGLIYKTFIHQNANDLVLKAYRFVMYIAVVHFASSLMFYNQLVIKFTSYLTLILSISSLIVCSYAVIRRFKYSSSFLLSFALFLFSSLAYTLKDLGIMNINEIQANYLVKISLLIEIFIFGAVMVRALFEEAKLISNSHMDQIIARSNVKIIRKLQHDIQSPLTSLEFFFNEAKTNLGEDLRLIGKQSINRIQDIINSLRINEDKTVVAEDEQTELVAIYPTLKRIISEKRNEFKNKVDLTINLETYDTKDYFVLLNKSHFYRSVSNIINNSIEAQRVNSDIYVNIAVRVIDGMIEILISDNGKGIDRSRLQDVFEYGNSFDKSNGSGIGLAQAREYIESISGKIAIESIVDSGTTISILLKKAAAPAWYAQDVSIMHESVVIVDDDDSIHNLWREKLSKMGIQTIHFKYSSDFERWATQNERASFNYFFDLELLGSKKTGIDLIKDYKLQDKSILVTSHFSDVEIQKDCSVNNIKMLPKESVFKLDIKKISNSNKSIVLIDDDMFTRLSWQVQGKQKGILVHCFGSVQEFMDSKLELDLSTPFYVDCDLGAGLRGEVLSEEIYKLGFTELNLATGSHPDEINVPHWIKQVRGKEFSAY